MLLKREARVARAVSFGALTLGAAAAVAAQTHPAAAGAVFTMVNNAVTCATTSACVSGTNKSSGPGVAGTSTSGNGIVGATKFNATTVGTSGVVGYDSSTNNNSVNSGVYGTSTAGIGVQGYSASNAGVYGHTSSGLGVYGIGGNDGVYGLSLNADGVGGYAYNSNQAGVAGVSDVGEGGYFQSAATTGIQVVNSNTSNPMTSTAITATTNGDANDLFNSTRAVLATNANGDGGEFAGSYIGLIGRAPTTGYPLDLIDQNDNDLFLVDGSGNTSINGNLTVLGTINGTLRTAGGSRVSAFVAKTAAPTIEDTGSAELSAGAAAVRLDPPLRRRSTVGNRTASSSRPTATRTVCTSRRKR